MIEVFKITHSLYDRTVSYDLSFNERANTRGNNYKLHNQSFHYDLLSIFSLHVSLIPGMACLIQLLMLALLMHLRHI